MSEVHGLLTVNEVAARLRVDPRSVRRMVADGRLTGVRVGPHHRIDPASLERMVGPTARAWRGAAVTAVVNQKGGVGKTTITANVAGALARMGRRVLAVDMDPQASLTVSLAAEPLSDEERGLRTIYDVLGQDDATLEGVIRRTDSGVDLVASEIGLAAAEMQLAAHVGREKLLAALIGPVREHYDHVLIDGPPSLSLLTFNVLGAADRVLIPVQCTFLAARGIVQLFRTLERLRLAFDRELPVIGIVPNQYDQRLAEEVATLEGLRGQYDGLVLDPIRASVRLKEAPRMGVPLIAMSRAGDLVGAFYRLAETLDAG